jgi:hypothetical protein
MNWKGFIRKQSWLNFKVKVKVKQSRYTPWRRLEGEEE